MSKPFTPNRFPALTSPRPTSTGSYFADSAINMDMSTPTRDDFATPPPLKSLPPLDALYTTSSHLFERLTQLAAAAWDAEQDGRLHESTVETLHKQLDRIESHIQYGEEQDGEEQIDEATPEKQPTLNRPLPQSVLDEATSASQEVLDSLTSTVSSLRLRHAEHRHLLQLSTSHLETISQRCLAQQRSVQSLTTELHSLRKSYTILSKQNEDLQSEVHDLRSENSILGQTNEDLTLEIQVLQSENTGKDVAMEAMAGAVSGLEGWIENMVPASALHTPDSTIDGGQRQLREVIRGRGRFRGRYYTDGSDDGLGDDGVGDMGVQDLHDGVKAWLRGFRDVEEGLRARGRGRGRERSTPKIDVKEDEWGNFESPDV